VPRFTEAGGELKTSIRPVVLTIPAVADPPHNKLAATTPVTITPRPSGYLPHFRSFREIRTAVVVGFWPYCATPGSLPTAAKSTDQIKAWAEAGLSKSEIACRIQISRTSFCRLLGST
jgi:hypothetical protein